MNKDFLVGDVISIRGVARDGTIDVTKPAKKWRVTALTPLDVILQPLRDDLSVDVFNDATGEFRICRLRDPEAPSFGPVAHHPV